MLNAVVPGSAKTFNFQEEFELDDDEVSLFLTVNGTSVYTTIFFKGITMATVKQMEESESCNILKDMKYVN